jgi:hypothetical protein
MLGKIYMKKVFIFLVSSVFLTDLFAQSTNILVVPPSPTVASLGKYGDIPVGKYSGIPNIDIPLYEIKSGQITLPVTMNYFAGGIKVEELASWVGLGWSLNAGGVITRSVIGAPDDIGNGIPYGVNVQKLKDGALPPLEKSLLEELITLNAADSEPDMFYYNFAGQSGKFFIGSDGQTCYTIPHQKIDIHFENNMQRWVVRTPDGMKYVFGQSIIDPNNTAIESIEQSVISVSTSPFGPSTSTSSKPLTKNGWYLMEVTSPAGDIVKFNYDTYRLGFKTLVNETNRYQDYTQFTMYITSPYRFPCLNCFNSNTFNYSTNTSHTYKLKSITYKTGRMDFNTPNTYRADLQGDKSLRSIAIYNYKDLSPIKTFNFNYSYFTSLLQPVESNADNNSNYDPKDYRLKLNSIAEIDSGNVNKPPYQFQYNESNPLPNGIYGAIHEMQTINPAFSQDHWGYYNGKSNFTLSPSYIDASIGLDPVIREGADRRVDPNYAQSDILTTITYPTGGYTTFEYESNSVPFSQVPQNSEVPLISKSEVEYSLTLDDLSQTNPSQKSLTFTVNSVYKKLNGIQGGFVNISYTENGQIIRQSNGLDDGCPFNSGHIYNSWVLTNTTTGQQWPDISGTEIFLPNGNYSYVLSRTTDNRDCKSVFSVVLTVSQYFIGDSVQPTTHMYVGGLRIKKIVSYDGYDHQKDIAKSYTYNLFDEPLTSSGSLVNIPVYGWKGYTEYRKCTVLPTEFDPSVFTITDNCLFSILSSSSNYPLLSTQGSFVGYANVTEIENSTNGRTEYTYTTARDYPDYGANGNFPFAPNTNFEWKRGLLTNETSFGSNNNKTKSKSYSYTFNPVITVSGLRLGIRFLILNEGNVTDKEYAEAYYDVKTGWYYLNSDNTIIYSSNNPAQSVQSRTTYKYNNPNHLQLSEMVASQSNGDLLTTKNLYPADYSPGTLFIDNLTGLYIHNVPIEKVVYKTDNTNAVTILSGQINTYNSNGTGLLDKSYKLETPYPIPAVNFNYSNSSGSYSPDTRYYNLLNPQIAYSYNNYNKINQIINRNGAANSYMWGYNNEYPVAEVKNASTTEFYYEGFEESVALGVIQGIGHTGIKYTTNATINWVRPNSRSYVISYYYRSGGAWKYQAEQGYSGSSFNLTGGDAYDDVRIYPSDAQMTTYTYDPLIGINSATDAKGQTSYYEYDSFQRLKQIKDHKGNILKSYDYNYKH